MTLASPKPNDTDPSRDVRMRGFVQRSDVEAVLTWIDANARRNDTEETQVDEAGFRVLAEDIVAGLDVPEFDRSAMDGYAVQASSTEGAGDYNPISLRLVGEAFPASPFVGSVDPGTTVRIMTGAPIPDGADSVVPAEYANPRPDSVELTQAASPGKHIGRIGEDIRRGSIPLGAGRILRPQDLGLIASLGISTFQVVRRPRVRLIVTGNEVVPPGMAKGLYQIFDANSSVLRTLVARDGGVLESYLRLPDDPQRLREALVAPGADVILVSGGSSVGAEDHAPRLVAELGALPIHGVAMRPSSPAGVGKINSALAFLLPGNPVSCLCAYDFFAGRAIRLCGGRSVDWPYRSRLARLSRKLSSVIGRVDYCRVRFEDDGRIEPLALSGASILSSTVRADGFVVAPAFSEGYGVDEEVLVYLYDK